MYFTITGAKNTVRYIEVSLNRGSTVCLITVARQRKRETKHLFTSNFANTFNQFSYFLFYFYYILRQALPLHGSFTSAALKLR